MKADLFASSRLADGRVDLVVDGRDDTPATATTRATPGARRHGPLVRGGPRAIDFADVRCAVLPACMFGRAGCGLDVRARYVCGGCYETVQRERKVSRRLSSAVCKAAWLALYTALVVTLVVLATMQQHRRVLKHAHDEHSKNPYGEAMDGRT
jgi:hypothetical protein